MRSQEKKSEIRKESRKRRNLRRNRRRAFNRISLSLERLLKEMIRTQPKPKGGRSKNNPPSSPRKKNGKSKPRHRKPTQRPPQEPQARPVAELLDLRPLTVAEALSSGFQGFLEDARKVPRRDLCGFQQQREIEAAPAAQAASVGSEVLLGFDKDRQPHTWTSEAQARSEGAVSFVRMDVTYNSERREKAFGKDPYALLEAAQGRQVIVGKIYLDPDYTKECKRNPDGQPRTLYRMPIKELGGRNLDITFDGKEEGDKYGAHRRNLLYAAIKYCKDVEYAYRDAGCVTVVMILKDDEDQPGWFKLLKKNLGVSVGCGPKVRKRMSQLDRGFFAKVSLDHSSVKILLLDGSTSYSKEDEEKLLDGLIPISADLFQELQDYKKEGSEDDKNLQSLEEKAKESPQFNGRMLLPAGTTLMTTVKGYKKLDQGCMVKGQFFKSYALPARTIAFHSCNVKKEITVDVGHDIRLYGDPQPGHDHSNMASQYLLCQQHVFSHEDVQKLFVQSLQRKLLMLGDGRYEREDQLKDLLWWGVLEHTYQIDIRLAAAQYAEKGDLRSMPHLAKLAWTYGMERLVLPDEGKLTLRIPFAVHWQVISATSAACLNSKLEVPQGLYFWEERKLIVVDDQSYLKMLIDHGGSDQDDLFDAVVRLVRTKPGETVLKVFLFRSPNDLGEYSVHDLKGPLPCGWNRKLEFIPQIDGPTAERPWPKRRSDNLEAVERIKHKFTKPVNDGKPWSLEKFKESLFMDMGNAGVGINAWMGYLSSRIHNDSWYEVCKENPIPKVGMEDMVDQNTQVCDPAAIAFCSEYAKELAENLDTECEYICKTFWMKGLQWNYSQEDRDSVFVTRVKASSLTKLLETCKKHLDEAIKEIKKIFDERASEYVVQEFYCPEAFQGNLIRQEYKKAFDVWTNRRKSRPDGVTSRLWEETCAEEALNFCLKQNRPLFGKGSFDFGRFVYLFQNDEVNRSMLNDRGEPKFGFMMNWLYSPSVWGKFLKFCEEKSCWTNFCKVQKPALLVQTKVIKEEPQEEQPMPTMMRSKPLQPTQSLQPLQAAPGPQGATIIYSKDLPSTEEPIGSPRASQGLERGGYKLNDQQEAAYESLQEFVKGSEKYLLLSGYAGTGKTLLISLFVQELLETSVKKPYVVMTAPTHKAVSVIQKKSEWAKKSFSVCFGTIHSALGLKLKPVENRQVLVKDPYGVDKVSTSDILVIDEASMLNEQVYGTLKKVIDKCRCKVIFMGDPCQLPPVNEKEATVFKDKEVRKIELTKVMRQADDNPAAFLVDRFRNVVLGNQTAEFADLRKDFDGKYDGEEGVRFLDANKLVDFAAERFTKLQHPDDLRLLSWTNKTAEMMNRRIREKIYGQDVEEFVVGEFLIMQDTIETDGQRLENSRVIKVLEASFSEEEIFIAYKSRGNKYRQDSIGSWPVWTLKVYHEEGQCTIRVISSSVKGKKGRLTEYMSNLGSQCYRQGDWSLYWEIKKIFAEVNYAFAETVHKSQGSTYQEVIPFLGDIGKNSNEHEARQCAYVAVSRAAKVVTIPFLP